MVLALVVTGCTTDDPQPGAETGSLSVALVVADGVEIDQVDWQITGNDTDKSGSIDVSAPGSTPSVEVYGLLPTDGEDYLVTLTAESTDGKVTCAGSSPFSVEVGVATEVMVILNCKLPRRYGGVRVNGKFNICAQLNMAIVSPLQTSVGNEIDLSAMAVDEEGDPIAYMWSASSGTFADAMAAVTTYTCTEVGDDIITILVTDDDGEYCMDMHSIPITCVAGEGDLCEGVTCEDDGNECTSEACNPSTGACESSNVDDGTDCNGDAGMCVGGECVDKDLCSGVTCEDDGNECTAAVCNPDTGECETSNVDDGTACGDGGACMNGTCVEIDLCEGVTCDDTGNECTVGVCNTLTGDCDELNVEDGTSCADDTGSCVAGTCQVGDLCEGIDCASGNDCVDGGTCNPSNGLCEGGGNAAINTPCDTDGVCDGQGSCVACNDATQCPDDGNQCTAATCEGNTCGLANVDNGTACGDGGVCTDGVCEVSTDLVIACEGTPSTAWRALPTTATGCTYNSVDTTCTNCNITGPSVPGGGQCGQFGAQIVHGCEVPGGVLNAQLAIDVTVSVTASTPTPGELHTEVGAVATNPALGTAAGLVTVDGAEFFTSITSATPAQVSNIMDPAETGQLLGNYTGGSNVLDLTDYMLPADTAIVATSNPVSINFAGNFLIELTIQASGTALNVDAASCTFDQQGAAVTCPAN